MSIRGKFLFSLAVLSLVYMVSCTKEPKEENKFEVVQKYLNLPEQPYNYAAQDLPEYFNNQFVTILDNTPADNRISDWGATLGRVLFYDKNLSFNKSISCASCHKQEFGFTDTARLSTGFEGGLTGRHSMTLINAAYYENGRFFWDERAATLEQQVLMPMHDPIEMGMTDSLILDRVRTAEYYPILFSKAFGTEDIDLTKISKALASFVRSIVSFHSKFDEGRKQVSDRFVDFPNFSDAENRGKNIFYKHPVLRCGDCHTTDLFILDHARNNGLGPANPDKGVFVHTQNPLDEGKFKTGSLKNLALRRNFMHDGRVTGLQTVIGHYDRGIKNNPTLDAHLIDANQQAVKMNLSPPQVDDLLAFLNTLTDFEIISDVKFSDPFR